MITSVAMKNQTDTSPQQDKYEQSNDIQKIMHTCNRSSNEAVWLKNTRYYDQSKCQIRLIGHRKN
jgi:hypothetical protein